MNIALIIWSNPEMYINLLFTAKKLLEKKNKVFLFCRGYPKNLRSFKYFNYFNKIQIISVPETENKYLDKINLLKLIAIPRPLIVIPHLIAASLHRK